MNSRRQFLATGLAAALLAAAISAPPAAAQINSLQILIPAAPGGGWDQTGRAIESAMRAEGLVSEFKIEHVPGAGGTVGLPKFISTKRGQGNALMVGGMVMVGAIIANKSPVKLTDVVPIARLTGEAMVVVVPAESPHKTMKDLIAALKADPGKVSWAGGSAGGSDHILAGLIAKAVGVDPRKVSYVAYSGGGPAQAALLGNQVTAGISGYAEFAEQIKAGKLRALAVSGERREPGIDVPTLKEAGVDVELVNWRGVFAPPGISDDQKKALVALVEKMAKSPSWKAELEKKGWADVLLTGDEFSRYVAAETTRITAILQDVGLAN
jgi:putative tricarboxylic transport membrane protein